MRVRENIGFWVAALLFASRWLDRWRRKIRVSSDRRDKGLPLYAFQRSPHDHGRQRRPRRLPAERVHRRYLDFWWLGLGEDRSVRLPPTYLP